MCMALENLFFFICVIPTTCVAHMFIYDTVDVNKIIVISKLPMHKE